MGNSVGRYRLTDEDLKTNFNKIKDDLGHVPLFSEFRKLSKISDTTYANRLGLKGKVYDKIIEYYTSEEEYENYLKEKSDHKSKIGKKTGAQSLLYSDNWLETHLKYIFDMCNHKYDVYPSRRYFDIVAIVDSSAYRHRFKRSWSDICKMYGYSTKQNNVEETLCLNMCKEILGISYTHWKTWDWLIGSGGKHMFCDGYYNEINTVIEFDGVYHRKAINQHGGYNAMIRQQSNDRLKDRLLTDHGIKIIRIDSRMNWQDKNKLKDYLMSQLV
jgi:very-short-patch-repair endonuclease